MAMLCCDTRIGFRCLTEVYVLIHDAGNLHLKQNMFQKKMVVMMEERHWRRAMADLELQTVTFHVNLMKSKKFDEFLIWKQNVRQLLFGNGCQCCICGTDRGLKNFFIHCDKCSAFQAFLKAFMTIEKDGTMNYCPTGKN